MLHCLPKHPTPCYHYCGDKFALSEFVADNGGGVVRFIGDTAIISSNYRGDIRQVTLYPTSWVRVILPGQFSAVNEVRFSQEFTLMKTEISFGEIHNYVEMAEALDRIRQADYEHMSTLTDQRKSSIWAKICKRLGWD